MPWFKVDDNLAFHAKAVAAGNAAMGLWVRAGSWSAQQLTDGFVPDHIADMLGTSPQVGRLVDNRLWDRVSGGFRFHEWTERQPTKEETEAERAAARERMRVLRAKRKGTSGASSQVSDSRSPEVRRTGPEVFGNPDPTPSRPDPTHSVVARPAKRATALPDDWKPNDKHGQIARENNLDGAAELEQFKDHHLARGSTFKDWDRAFNTWLRNAVKFDRRATRPNRQQGVDLSAAMQRAAARDAQREAS